MHLCNTFSWCSSPVARSRIIIKSDFKWIKRIIFMLCFHIFLQRDLVYKCKYFQITTTNFVMMSAFNLISEIVSKCIWHQHNYIIHLVCDERNSDFLLQELYFHFEHTHSKIHLRAIHPPLTNRQWFKCHFLYWFSLLLFDDIFNFLFEEMRAHGASTERHSMLSHFTLLHTTHRPSNERSSNSYFQLPNSIQFTSSTCVDSHRNRLGRIHQPYTCIDIKCFINYWNESMPVEYQNIHMSAGMRWHFVSIFATKLFHARV